MAPVGIGPIDAGIGASRALAACAAARIVFVGTAGAYGAVARRLLGRALVAADFVCVSTAALREEGYLPEATVLRATAAPALTRALAACAADVAELRVACPLAITRSAALARRIAGATGATLENLEVFAVARAAAAAGVEMAAVLGIANRVGPNAQREWRANHLDASETACAVVAAFLTRSRGHSAVSRKLFTNDTPP
jgi:nucleoside phosphorylase